MSRSGEDGAAARTRMAEALKLAAGLGATLATVPARSVFDGLCAHIIETRATAVVVGKSRRNWWFELRHGSVVDRLVRTLDGVAVHVVPVVEPVSTRPNDASTARKPVTGRIVIALALVAVTTAGAILLRPLIGLNSIDLLYLLPVIASATLLGLRPSLFASLAAALAYNFFFLPPLYTFTISDPQNVVTLLVLVAVAVVASQLAGRLKREATVGARTATENAALSAFGQRLAAVADSTGTAAAVCEEIARLLDVATVLLARRDGGVDAVGASPPDPSLGPLDLTAGTWAFDRGEVTGFGSGTLTSSDWQFHPLETSLGVLGVLGVSSATGGDPIAPDRRVLFATLLGQAALAHERLKLEADAREVDLLKQRDLLRATVLSSIGHDLKTPLTAVVAAADALAAEHGGSTTADLLRGEARRLRRVFDDLVEMTRIEAGALRVKQEATDLTDAVTAAVADLWAELRGHKVVVDVSPTLPLVDADPRMLHHVLINLVGNAAKFSPLGTEIAVRAVSTPTGVTLAILDEGPGLPVGRETRLFDRFERLDGDDMSGGTGLGLAIVKGFVSAMGLEVTASNTNAGGARFAIDWPAALVRLNPVEE